MLHLADELRLLQFLQTSQFVLSAQAILANRVAMAEEKDREALLVLNFRLSLAVAELSDEGAFLADHVSKLDPEEFQRALGQSSGVGERALPQLATALRVDPSADLVTAVVDRLRGFEDLANRELARLEEESRSLKAGDSIGQRAYSDMGCGIGIGLLAGGIVGGALFGGGVPFIIVGLDVIANNCS